MDEARHRCVSVFVAGISQFPRRGCGFLDARDDLASDRAVRVGAVNEVEEVWRDGEGQLLPGEQYTFAFLGCKRQEDFQRFYRCDAMTELPAPVVPVRWRDVRPQPLPSSRLVSLHVGGTIGVARMVSSYRLDGGGVLEFLGRHDEPYSRHLVPPVSNPRLGAGRADRRGHRRALRRQTCHHETRLPRLGGENRARCRRTPFSVSAKVPDMYGIRPPENVYW